MLTALLVPYTHIYYAVSYAINTFYDDIEEFAVDIFGRFMEVPRNPEDIGNRGTQNPVICQYTLVEYSSSC